MPSCILVVQCNDTNNLIRKVTNNSKKKRRQIKNPKTQ